MGTSPSYDLLDEHNNTSSNNLNNAGGAPASSSPLFRHQRATLLEKVQLVGHGLLHWCGVLETQRLPSDVTLDAVAHNVALLSRDLNAALQDCLVKCEGLLFPSTDGVTKRGLARVAGSLPTSRSPSAGRGGSPPPALDRGQQRAANFWSYYKRECFDPCFANLGQLTSNAKLFVLMRELVASRDGAKVETLLAELKRQSSSTTSGAQRPALRVGNDPSRNAFVQWVETRWLPAVKEWEELIRNAKKQIESDGETTGSSSGPITQQPQQQQQREHMLSTPAAAAMSRNAAKIATAADRAIASVHRDIVSRSASLKEILRPGETVEQLLHGSVEADLRALAKQKIAQRDALDALRTAVEKVQFVQLASCLREAEPFLPYLSNQSADRSLIAEAQSLLVDVQRVAKTTVGISLASKSRDTMMLLRAIHQANETMSHLRIYSDEATMKRALKHGADHTAASSQTNAVVGTQCSAVTIPNVLRAEGSRLLRVEHVPSKAWAPELSVMYQQACELLDELLLVQKLEQQLQVLMTQQQGDGGDDDGSGGNNSSEELKRVVEQCRQFGVQGPLLTAAEQLVASSNALRVKVHFDSRIRLVVIDGDQISNFSVVQHRIASVCPNSTPSSSIGSPPSSMLRIRYQDDDGDYVSLLDQADWDALLSDLSAHFARQQRNRSDAAATQPPASSDAPQLGSSGKQQRRVEVYCDYPLLPAVQSTPSSFGSPMGQQQQAKPSTPLQNNKAQNAPGRLGALTPATPASSDTTKLQVAGVGMSGSGNGPRPAVVNASPLVRAAGSTPPSEPSTPPVPPPPNGPSPRRTSHPEQQQQQQVPPDRRAATSEPKTATSTIRVGVENVSRWEAAAAEALELLTIASQDTSASARTSLARDVSQALGGGRSSQSPPPQPQQIGIQVANRGLIRPGDVGRWADASDVDTTDIQTIASIETSRPNPMVRPVSSPQLKSPNSAGIPTTGSMPPPAASSSNANHREKSVMMLAQLRKQKQALESASKASQQQSHRQQHDGATKK